MIETYRCRTDGRVMTENLCKMGFCAGHYLNQPANPSILSVIALKLGVYEWLMKNKWLLNQKFNDLLK